MGSNMLWLRSESDQTERRVPLCPEAVGSLVGRGIPVIVEKSAARVFSDDSYANNGARLVETGAWVRNTDPAVLVIGLRPPKLLKKFIHKHVCYAHCYKKQPDAETYLAAFARGGGMLYDYESLVFDRKVGGKKISTSYHAGVAAVIFMCSILLERQDWIIALMRCVEPNIPTWLLKIKKAAQVFLVTVPKIKILVFGANGTAGRAVIETLTNIGFSPEKVDRVNYLENVNPLGYDIVFNCIARSLEDKQLPPLLSEKAIQTKEKRLALVIDVTCEPRYETGFDRRYLQNH